MDATFVIPVTPELGGCMSSVEDTKDVGFVCVVRVRAVESSCRSESYLPIFMALASSSTNHLGYMQKQKIARPTAVGEHWLRRRRPGRSRFFGVSGMIFGGESYAHDWSAVVRDWERDESRDRQGDKMRDR